MADKKISALSLVADTDIGADDLLHIVDNPGGTPVNKKMTIGQLFQNIPSHVAVDDITTLTTTNALLASSFATLIDISATQSADVNFTLGVGTHMGQLKVIVASTEPYGSYRATIDVTAWGYSTDTTDQIILDSRGDSLVLIWNGTKWFPISNNGATLS